MPNAQEKASLHRHDLNPTARGPLNGLRVVDLSRLVAGNVLSLLLADFGAEVIKVEPPSGDTLRAWRIKGIETYWKVYARNKKSIGIDLRHAEGPAIVRKLVAGAQVFIESFRPGQLEAMGLSPEELLTINPSLVIVRVSGWGQSGPYRHKPGFGTLIEGYSGFAALNGFADREPLLPPISLADMLGGLYGSTAVLTALRNAEQGDRRGQVIDLSLFEPLLSILGPRAANYRLTQIVPPRSGNRSVNSAPRNAYRTRDGKWVCLSASTQGMTEKLFHSIGRPDLAANPRFATNAERMANIEELDSIIGGFIEKQTLAKNLEFFDKAGVTIGPIYDIAELMTDHYVIERESMIEVPDEEMGFVPMHNVVPRLLGTPGSIRTPAPRFGEHNAAILEPALGPGEFQRLLAAGAIVAGPPRRAKSESGPTLSNP